MESDGETYVPFDMLSFAHSGTYMSMWLPEEEVSSLMQLKRKRLTGTPFDDPLMQELEASCSSTTVCKDTVTVGRQRGHERLCLVRVSSIDAFDETRLLYFIKQRYPVGEVPAPHLVFGCHGVGTALRVCRRVIYDEASGATIEEDTPACLYSIYALAALFRDFLFRTILFDACVMATVQCAAAFCDSTEWVGACEGYMWEEDKDAERHLLNSHSACALSFGPPSRRGAMPDLEGSDILEELREVVQHYSGNERGDVAVLSTAAASNLLRHLQHRRSFFTSVAYRPSAQDGTAQDTMCLPIDAREMEEASRLFDVVQLLKNLKEMADSENILETEWIDQAMTLLGQTVVAQAGPSNGTYYSTPLSGLSISL